MHKNTVLAVSIVTPVLTGCQSADSRSTPTDAVAEVLQETEIPETESTGIVETAPTLEQTEPSIFENPIFFVLGDVIGFAADRYLKSSAS